MKKTVYLTICLVLLSVVASCTAQFSEPKGIIEYEGQEVNLSLDGIREVYGWNPQIKDISNEYGNGKGVISVSFPKNWTPDDGYDIFDICYILSDYNVSITSIVIPDGETTIVEEAFGGCSSLTSITLPESLTTIEERAFWDCSSLTSITIPEGVTTIGAGAFSGCSSLSSIVVASGNTIYDSRGNCNCIIEKNTGRLIKGSNKSSIPEGVTTIEGGAFSGCSSLTSITLPESLTLIEGGAFKFCTSLTSVTILSDWLDNMGFDVFYGCSSLVEVICSESFYDFYGHILFAGCPVLNK